MLLFLLNKINGDGDDVDDDDVDDDDDDDDVNCRRAVGGGNVLVQVHRSLGDDRPAHRQSVRRRHSTYTLATTTTRLATKSRRKPSSSTSPTQQT